MNTEQFLKMEAREEGILNGLKQSVLALLKNSDFSLEKIASLLDVPISLVNEVQRESSVR